MLVVALVAVALSLAACSLNNEAEATEVSEHFLADVKVGTWHAATSRMHSDMRAACESAAGLERRVAAADVRPQSWVLRDISAFNHTGYIQVKVITPQGDERYTGLELEKEDGEFKVRNWLIAGQDLCGEP